MRKIDKAKINQKRKIKDQYLKLLHICSAQHKQEKHLYLSTLAQQIRENRNFLIHIVIPNMNILFEMVITALHPIPENSYAYSLPLQMLRPVPLMKQLIQPLKQKQKTLQCFMDFIVMEETSVKQLKAGITKNFIYHLIHAISTQDQNTSFSLICLFQRLYAKMVPRRKTMRLALLDILRVICLQNIHFQHLKFVISFLNSITSGFAIPLRQENTQFFKDTILPLLKLDYLDQFYSEISQTISIFVQKQYNLGYYVLKKLFKIWPKENYNKKVCFIELVEKMLKMVSLQGLERNYFIQLVKIVVSETFSGHMVVSKAAILLFRNQNVIKRIKQDNLIAQSAIVPLLQKIQDKGQIIVKINELNSIHESFKEVNFEELLENNIKRRQNSQQKWRQLRKKAIQINPELQN